MASRAPPFNNGHLGDSGANLKPSSQEGGNSSDDQIIDIDEEYTKLMMKCAVDFITFLTKEANRYSKLKQKDIVTADDLVDALKNLGEPFTKLIPSGFEDKATSSGACGDDSASIDPKANPDSGN